MDKTLEIVMVAVALIVAAVIVVGLLQGQVNMFGGFASNQTNSSGCGVSRQQYCSAVPDSGDIGFRAARIYKQNSGCAWATTSASSVTHGTDVSTVGVGCR